MKPRKLAHALKTSKSQRGAARLLGINQYYINRFMKYAEEPTNPKIRHAMGFKPIRKKQTGRSGFRELPHHIQWWRKLPKEIRSAIVREAWIQRDSLTSAKDQ